MLKVEPRKYFVPWRMLLCKKDTKSLQFVSIRQKEFRVSH